MKWLDEGVHIDISEWMAAIDTYAKDHPFTFICLLLAGAVACMLLLEVIERKVKEHYDNDNLRNR